MIKPITIFAVILIAIIVVTNISRNMFGKVDVPQEVRQFSIERGQSVKQITRDLVDKGIIKNDFLFRTLVLFTGKQSEFMAGNFDLPEEISSSQLIRLLTTQGKKETKTIKILEGWGIYDIAQYFEQEGLFSQEEFFKVVGREAIFNTADNDFYNELVQDYPLLKYRTAGAPLEGFLFPDTYEIYADSTVEDVVRKMVANFHEKVTQDLIDEIGAQGKNFYKVLIMASIIEAEVTYEDERPVVSDIFWSRMDIGMPLQSCATLNYRIEGTNPALTDEQLKIDSVYNTYMYREMPPTPIGNPGISSIRAAIYPQETDYFYFLSTPEGETIFSHTLDKHNTAKAEWLK
ncbi:endolytic transglycosylase MltG [Patescibacteria group bacterium]|nr:endolytic transglycosylase MltG [Patescibacteria group bacterium]